MVYKVMASTLEYCISRVLHQNHLTFTTEKTFEDLHHGLYRYDFYLPSLNVLIEAQGTQHYTYSKFFHKKRSDFTKAQERDRRKISYALVHKIPLYCIPYWDIDSIHTLSDIFKPEYLATSKFHNDIVYRNHQKSKASP